MGGAHKPMMQGVFSDSGSRRTPRLVRMGKPESMHTSVAAFHIDAVVEQLSKEVADTSAAGAVSHLTGNRHSFSHL
jgi:hypothetical protein